MILFGELAEHGGNVAVSVKKENGKAVGLETWKCLKIKLLNQLNQAINQNNPCSTGFFLLRILIFCTFFEV